jgi:hypothetical protein
MYCAKCNKNFPGGQFCPDCGTTLLASPIQNPVAIESKSIGQKIKSKPLVFGGALLLAIILVIAGVKVATDAAANDAKDNKISKALDSCGITYSTGVDILAKRHALLTDSDSTSLAYSDFACVITALGGPSKSEAYQLVKDEYSSDVYFYGDVKIELAYSIYLGDTLEIWIQ